MYIYLLLLLVVLLLLVIGCLMSMYNIKEKLCFKITEELELRSKILVVLLALARLMMFIITVIYITSFFI